MTTADTRFARHHVLTEVGTEGQKTLAAATITIVGLGGLGNPAALALAAAGIGRLTLIDYDDVDPSNLARQWLFDEADVGQSKAQVAARKLAAQFEACEIRACDERIDVSNAESLLRNSTAVLDCTDNFHTRRTINAACVEHSLLLVSGAAIRCEGQVMEFGPDYVEGPCYACVYPDDDERLESCQRDGILGPATAAIGAMMAARATLRICGQAASEKMTLIDFGRATTAQLNIAKRMDCAVCRA